MEQQIQERVSAQVVQVLQFEYVAVILGVITSVVPLILEILKPITETKKK